LPLHAFYMLCQSLRGSVHHKPLHELFQIFNYPFFLLRSTSKVFLLQSSQIRFHETALRDINIIIIVGRTNHAYTRLAIRQKQIGSADRYSMHVLVSICIIDCDNESEISLSQ
jgi:hypothetical protein